MQEAKMKAAVIADLGHHQAPRLIEMLWIATDAGTRLFLKEGRHENVKCLCDRLLKDFPKDDAAVRAIVGHPDFLAALCALLHESLAEYVGELTQKPEGKVQ